MKTAVAQGLTDSPPGHSRRRELKTRRTTQDKESLISRDRVPGGAASKNGDNAGLSCRVKPSTRVSPANGNHGAHHDSVNQDAPGSVITELVGNATAYEQFMRTETALRNQIASIERRLTGKRKRRGQEYGDTQILRATPPSPDVMAGLQVAVAPLRAALAPVHAERLKFERALKATASQLPAWAWVSHVRGMKEGLLYARLVAQAIGRDTTDGLRGYSNPAKLWKRFGLAVIDGKAQRRISGKGSAKKTRNDATAEAILHGYSPSRRALAYMVSFCIRNAQKKTRGPYYVLYAERKVVELAKVKAQAPTAKNHKSWAEKRALRYLAKRFLRDLWCQWQEGDKP